MCQQDIDHLGVTKQFRQGKLGWVLQCQYDPQESNHPSHYRMQTDVQTTLRSASQACINLDSQALLADGVAQAAKQRPTGTPGSQTRST